jgi:hypothetical protein
MVKQNHQKVAIFAILLTTLLAIGIYQQASATDSCDYYSCYNYPEQKESLNVAILSEPAGLGNTAGVNGL